MKWRYKLLVIFLVGGLLPAKAFAQASELDHKVVRRLTVFPFKVPSAFKEVAEDSWWEVRKFCDDPASRSANWDQVNKIFYQF